MFQHCHSQSGFELIDDRVAAERLPKTRRWNRPLATTVKRFSLTIH